MSSRVVSRWSAATGAAWMSCRILLDIQLGSEQASWATLVRHALTTVQESKQVSWDSSLPDFPGLLIGGEWVTDRASRIDVRFPFDDSQVASLPLANAEDTLRAIESASAFHERRVMPRHRRSALLESTAESLMKRSAQFARVLVLEVGKTIREAEAEVRSAIAILQAMARAAMDHDGRLVPLGANRGLEGRIAYWQYVPAGPVCGIAPFNAPLNNAATKIGGAIAAGNAIVFKPATSTPLTALMLAEIIFEQDAPTDLVSVIVGKHDEVGQLLLHDSRFRRYTFTGSVQVGHEIASTVSPTPAVLELGSNSPVIVHEDADLDLAVSRCAASGFVNAGQICTAVQQIHVSRKVVDDFVSRFVEATSSLDAGDPRFARHRRWANAYSRWWRSDNDHDRAMCSRWGDDGRWRRERRLSSQPNRPSRCSSTYVDLPWRSVRPNSWNPALRRIRRCHHGG